MVICDFCNAPDPKHCWVSKPAQFKLQVGKQALVLNSDEHWAACDTCHVLISNFDAIALAQHSASMLDTKLPWPVIYMMHQTVFWPGKPHWHSGSEHSQDDEPQVH